ncbi:MAG: glycoside hydrolase family 31 protein [Acetatifactor sp.]|nr:glycoside hydrolase family 31 protein [Acetatifactor sp.]
MITGTAYRITTLTDRMIRLEYNKDGKFVDECTQLVANRDFPECPCKILREKDGLRIDTGKLVICYDEKPFASGGLSIEVKSTGAVWHYGKTYASNDKNFRGTGRTLDGADGGIWLEKGLFGGLGYGVLDDSTSPILLNGEFQKREKGGLDLYFFGYGKDYREGLKDFMRLAGSVPLLPRYALGNWWSRYHRYTEEEYTDLLDRFEEEKIPLSVAVIDMDWHLTKVDPKYGSGWTGYTWDPECFPDPERFLKGLKDRGLAVTLNLHPADGIRPFESMYGKVAARMGKDPKKEETIPFDFEDHKFRETYFTEIMHPMEEMGVDFWWIDWQQGTGEEEGKPDPLLLLNHHHFEDRKKSGGRAMIFSRYAGPGSHRYPVGFSGDTIMSWKSLEYQPYFTFTAANIGYGWWSHDIGGHMMGSKDEERLIRWIQFGVFSPIMRLHSSNSPFFNKEPWTLKEPYRRICGEFMRLRHRLIPYLYTMNELCHREGRVLCEPMYYAFPEEPLAYEVKGEYTFGTELIVGSVTSKIDPELRKAQVYMYVPKGRWYDLFSGRIYQKEGGRRLYRGIGEIPVLLKAGGVLPLQVLQDPKALQILLGYGASGTFTLYEDDGVTTAYEEGHAVTTKMELEQGKKGTMHFRIEPAEGDLSLIPAQRSYEICLYGVSVTPDTKAEIRIGKKKQPAELMVDEKRHVVTVKLPETVVTRPAEILWTGLVTAENDMIPEVFGIMDDAYCETGLKERVYDHVCLAEGKEEFRNWLREADIPPVFREALQEVMD